MSASMTAFAYLIASVCFIMALRGLNHPRTARQGNIFGIVGMTIAVLATVLLPGVVSLTWIVIGIAIGGAIGAVIALKIAMTALPQLVAGFHSLVGMAAVLVAGAAFFSPEAYGIGTVGNIKIASLIEMSIGTAIGAMTFTGSIIAFGKLQGLVTGKPLVFPGQHMLNLGLGVVLVLAVIWLAATENPTAFWVVIAVSLVIGVTLILPIGGADMPVVVSMLNSYSGWAAAGIGFTLGNPALIVVGALVGSSGAILSYIMCKGMNRSFISVILGGFGGEAAAPGMEDLGDRTVRQGSAEDAAFIMEQANSVIIVPGYGMAVAQAQHALAEMVSELENKGVQVRYAIHPVAGRMPGHMNVLLAEADVSYDKLFDLEEINDDFNNTDAVLIVGANDVVNPSAREPDSIIAGMPILDVDYARRVIVMMRSLSPGFAGIDNDLFYLDNTLMFFGDAKESMGDLVREVRELA